MTDIRRYPDADALADAAAALFVQTASDSIAAQGRFTVALSGGSTPRTLHALLAAEPYRGRVAWPKVHVFWGDERAVPPEHPDSNYRMARETLLDHVPIPEAQVHRMHGDLEPQVAADAYEATLRATFDEAAGDGFDLVFLGMGDDGHTLSLFPGTAAVGETRRLCVANHVDKLASWRITLTAPFVNRAKNVAFLVAGAKKAATLKRVLQGPRDVEALPAQLIAPVGGHLAWLVDEAAAADLDRQAL